MYDGKTSLDEAVWWIFEYPEECTQISLDIKKPTLLIEEAESIINAVRILSTYNLEDIRKPFSFWESYYLKKMQISKDLLQQEAHKLLMYFAEQSLWPRFWEMDDKAKKKSNIDWPLLVIANLVKNGCTLQEAWQMPESEAVWLHIAFMDIQGIDPKVVSDTEWNAMQNALKETKPPKTKHTK